MAGLTLEQQQDIIGKWRASPIVRHYSFSDKKLWSKQEEVEWSVRNNKRTAVKSANTVGKSFMAADVVMDFLTIWHNSVVVTTAPTFHQVETILWREIRNYCFTSKIPIGVTPLQTELKYSDKWYAIGVSVDNPVNFQGKHAESGKLLVVVDEASGITKEIWDMIEALHPYRILVIGNPLESSGPFCECFSSHMWNKITISAMDAILWQDKNGTIPGLVTREWVNDMADIHGTSSPWYRVHVLGEFPEQDESALIERSWVLRARKGIDCDGLALEEDEEDDSTRIVGSDIATKHGENLSVVGYRYGHTIPELKGYPRASATFTRDKIEDKYSDKKAHTVVVDSDGVGEPMEEILAESRVPCLAFHGGNTVKAMDGQRFKNLRSQIYYLVSKKFEKGLYNLSKLDDKAFDILIGQLTSIRVKEPDNQGRFQIESKDDMRARQVTSPDYADTFMMMEYAFFMRKHAELSPMRYGNL